MGTGLMFLSMFGLLLLGVPIGVSLACSVLILLTVNPLTTTEFVAQALYSGLDSFTLISLPFFMIAGTIMEAGGISKRIVNAANSIVGNITGSLGMVTIIACMFFGAVSGSAIATVAAIGGIMLPAMVKSGYDKVYATALVAIAGSLGMIIPPSTPMVVYGVTNNVSIGDLFMAGFLPGLLIGGALMVVNYVICKHKGYGVGIKHKVSGKNIGKAFWDAKWALFMPLIILGGIYSGIVTPTEASVVACVYGILVGLLVYKELTFKKLWQMFKDNTCFIGAMLFTFAPAGALSSIFAYLKVPDMITRFFTGITTNQQLILLMMLVLLLIVGMFLETTPSIILFSPILYPVATSVGVDPVHFGIFVVVALAMGLVTPPVAMDLFVAQSMTGISMLKIAKKAVPFLLAMFTAVLLITLIPEISMVLVKLFAK